MVWGVDVWLKCQWICCCARVEGMVECLSCANIGCRGKRNAWLGSVCCLGVFGLDSLVMCRVVCMEYVGLDLAI